MSFLCSNDLVNTILSMAITTKVSSNNIPKNLIDEINVLFPQNITSQQIQNVKDLIDQGTPCFEAIAKTNIYFPFKPDFLNQIVEDKNFIENEPNLTSTIIFFSCLSWIVAHSLKATNAEHLNILFDSLMAICITCQQQNIKSISISSMYNILILILSKNIDNYDFDAKIDLIFDVVRSIPNIPPQFFDIIVKASYILIDSQPSEKTVNHFIQIILNLLKQFHLHFPKTVFDILSPIISKKASILDNLIIDLISTMCNVYGSDSAAPYLASILMFFVSQIKENSILPKTDEFTGESDFVMLPIRTKDESQKELQVEYDSDFNSPIDLKTMPITIPDEEPLENLISPKLKETLSVVSSGFKGKADLVFQLINFFNQILSEKGEFNNSYDAFAFSILFLINVYDSCKYSIPVDVFFNKVVFDPAFTAHNKGKNWSIISSLRSTVINFVFHKSTMKFYKFIVKSSRFPLLFSELLYRLSSYIKKMVMTKEFVLICYTLFLESNIYYENMTGLDEYEIKCIREARFSIFYFIEKLLRNKQILIHCFMHEKFMKAYIPLIFEIPLQPFIFQTITRFVQNNMLSENNAFNTVIINVLEQASHLLSEAKWVAKLLKVLNGINEIIQKDQNLCYVLEQSIPCLCTGFRNLCDCESAQACLLALIRFLTYHSKMHRLKSIETISISTTIQRVVGKNPPQPFFDHLVQLAAGSVTAVPSKSFDIEQPRALRVLIQIFTNSPLLSDIIDFIELLCKHSKENTIKVHQDEIDIILIDLIEKFREKEEDEESRTLVQKILNLFSYISNSGSSVAVVQRYISVFCLVNGRHLPWFHNMTIDTFISLLTQSTEETKLTIPFTHSSEFEVKNLNSINDEFTLCCWVSSFCTAPKYSMQLISISDKKGQIKIYLKSKSIAIVLTDNNLSETRYPLALNEWTLVSISFQMIKKNEIENFKVTLYNNTRRVKEITIPYVKLQKSNLQVSVGGTFGDSSNDPETPSVFSQISLYPLLTIDDIKTLYQSGSSAGNLNLHPSFIFIPYEPFDTIMLNNLVPNSQILSLTEIPPLYPSSFADVFRKRVGIDLILPIFAQWGLKSIDGKEMNDLPQKSMTILRESLLRSEEAQRTFDEAHGIEIISFLLQSTKKKTINLSLYMHFFDIITNLSDKPLIEKVFTHILTNIQLWIEASGSDQLKIIRNWNKHLFPSYMSIAVKNRPFKWVLNVMRIYYYYKKCESDIQKPRPDQIDIKSIRKSLSLLIIQLANASFTSADLCYLICTILSCPEEEQQMDYLRILNALITKGKNSPVLKAHDSFNYIKILQYLANSRNINLSILSMLTLINAYRASYFHPLKSDTQIDIILHQMPSELVNRDFFENLLKMLTKNTPELFVLVSWMALNLGYNYVVKLYDELKPSPQYITSCSWCIWSIITMFKFNAAIVQKVSSFLIKCSIAHFGQIYAFVELVGMVYKKSTDEMKSMILNEFYKILKESKDASDQVIKLYFTYARHYLFFRNQANQDDRMMMLMKDSPFADQVQVPPTVKQFDELVNELKHRPNLNSDGTERYSPDLANRAIQIIAPKKEEEIKEQNDEVISTISVAASHINLPKLNVTFANAAVHAPQPNRRNLIRRNSIFTIQKQNAAPRRRGLVFNSISNKGRRAAHAFISSTLNALLGNDTVAIYNELIFHEIKYMFHIREGKYEAKDLDEYSINWLDKETAFDFLIMYSIKPFPEFESTVILIASYLLYQNPDLALKTISNLNIKKEELQNAFSYYDRNAIRTNNARLMKHFSEIDIWNHSNEFLDSFISQTDLDINYSYMTLTKQIKEYEDKNSRASNDTFNLLTPEYAGMANDSIADFNDALNQTNTISNKYWQQLWHNLSIERAPWNKSLPPNMLQQYHYRRDLSLCYSLFPPKMKINYKFDIHLEASLVRDTGDQKTGKSKTEELKEQLKTMYEQGSDAYSLFEISEESIKEKSNNNLTASKCIIELPCEIVKINKTYEEASFLLMEDSIVLTVHDKKSTVIKLNTIESIFPRTRYHHMSAIEIFTIDGLSYFVNFPNFSTAQVLKSFKSSHVKIHPCDFKASFQQSKMTEKWQRREISNFHYLMALNTYSGRSPNDISQYPVFPWIISDYDSKELDLTNPSVFRDLSKPIGALYEPRLEELKEKAAQLEQMEMTPYLFSSCFLCPLTVCLYMLRLEPYTTMHIDIQGGHFDVPSRVFSSVKTAFNLCNTTLNDYRELIPEFFTMHEFLVNNDRFDLGYSGDEKIDDVKLPSWANDSAIEFIYKNRKALESEYVSQNLNNWIDLIWGDKQRGEKAWQANNVFMREMYADIWDVTPLDDVNQRVNVEAILCNVGQVPPMLFDKPHPVPDPIQNRQPIPQIKAEFALPVSKGILAIELKENGKNISVYVIDSDFGFLTFSYDPLIASKCAQSSGMSTSCSIDQLASIANEAAPPASPSQSSANSNSNNNSNNGNANLPSSPQKMKVASLQTHSSMDLLKLSRNSDLVTSSEKNQVQLKRRPQAPTPGPLNGKQRSLGRDLAAIRQMNQSQAAANSAKILRSSTDFQKSQKPNGNAAASPQGGQNEGSQQMKKRFISLGSQSISSSSFDIFGSFINKNNSRGGGNSASNSSSNSAKLISSFTMFDSFDYAKENLHDIVRVNKNESVHRFKHRSEIKLIASDHKWTAVADRDSVVSLYFEKTLKFSIPLFSSSIKCLTISSTFHIAICGTRDGFLLFGSLNSGTVTKTINLNGMRPIKLLITPSWGFVAVYLIEVDKGKLNYYIKLYTINGDFIRSKKLDHPVHAWKAFHTFHDFDYILMANSEFEVFLFEAFYLNIGNSIYSSDKPISDLAYVKSANCVVLASDVGNLSLFTAKLPV